MIVASVMLCKNADDRQISLARWARGTQCHKGEETARPVETQPDADTASNQSSSSCPIPCSPAGLNTFCLECYSFPKLNNLHSGSHDPSILKKEMILYFSAAAMPLLPLLPLEQR